jgi:hypothetical protein
MAPGQGTRSSSYEVATDDNPYNLFLQKKKKKHQATTPTQHQVPATHQTTAPASHHHNPVQQR